MDVANHALAHYLGRQGRHVHLVTFRAADDLHDSSSITIHRVPKPRNAYLIGSPLLNLAGRRLFKAIGSQRPHVLVNGGNCPIRAVNWVHYVHAAYQPTSHLPALRRAKQQVMHRLDRYEEAKALRRARVIIANSERTKTDITQHIGVAPERIRTIYYGIDAERFRPAGAGEREALRLRLGLPTDTRLVAFVGALGDDRKGFETVFKSWATLCASQPWNATLLVIGTGAALKTWQERATQQGIGSRVRFLGFRKDVPDILRASDALVAPTRYEAYGLGVHEALCCGIPAFVSRASGVAERFSPELSNCLIDNPDSDVELGKRLRDWERGIGQMADHAMHLSDVLRKRSWDDMARDIVKLCEEVS